MANSLEEKARDDLIARQGVGARYDAPEAPADALRWARRGTAYLARRINDLSDARLDGPGRNGQSRRQLIARVSYEARALSQVTEGVRTSVPARMQDSLDFHAEDVLLAETLPAHALRYLFKHSEVHLNVEWRDLPGAGWAARVAGPDNNPMTMVETVLVRAKTVWAAAVELGNGGRLADVPSDLLDALGDRARAAMPEHYKTPGHDGAAAWLLGLSPCIPPSIPPDQF